MEKRLCTSISEENELFAKPKAQCLIGKKKPYAHTQVKSGTGLDARFKLRPARCRQILHPLVPIPVRFLLRDFHPFLPGVKQVFLAGDYARPRGRREWWIESPHWAQGQERGKPLGNRAKN